jgi:hypothetical protein
MQEEKIREIMQVLKYSTRAERATQEETMGTTPFPLIAPLKEKDNAPLTSSTT